jgi:hypothetical protein
VVNFGQQVSFTESESRGVSSCRISFCGDSHQLGG